MRWIGLLLWQLLPLQQKGVNNSGGSSDDAKGLPEVVENHGGGSMVAAADPMRSSVMDADAPPELLQLRCQGVGRIHGFRRSSAQPLSPRQRRRRWGWPVSSNSSTCASAMRNSWK